MKLTIEMSMDNAAFDDDPSYEASSVLTQLGQHLIRRGVEVGATGKLYDTNGNSVGTWTVTE